MQSTLAKNQSRQLEEVNLAFTIDSIQLGNERFTNIKVNCHEVTINTSGIACRDAVVSFASQSYGRFVIPAQANWRLDTKTYEFRTHFFAFAGGRAKISIVQLASGQSEMTVRLDKTTSKLLWPMLQPKLPGSFQEYEVETGLLSGEINCRIEVFCDFDITVRSLNFSGVNAAENADLDINLRLSLADQPRLSGAINLIAGTIYIEPGFSIGSNRPGFLITATRQPVSFSADLALPTADNPLKIYAAKIEHHDVVSLVFDGSLIFGENINWGSLHLKIASKNIARMYKTYIQPVIFGTTVDSLEIEGEIDVALVGKSNEITDLKISLTDTFVDDASDRFAMYGLNGDFVLTSGAETQASSIVWQGAGVYGISFGSGRIDWGSSNRNVWIAAWDDVSVFDGALRFDELSVSDFGTRDASVAISGSLAPVTMQEVMASFGLPPLAGKVSATLPRVSFKKNQLVIDGNIEINLFEGLITAQSLKIKDLFSSVPRLSTTIDVEGIDLATLTSTFSFGNIAGTLDGHVKELILEDWRPRSFKAFFATRKDDTVRHRISRQAVDNLGRIGAQTSVLSSGWLRFIPDYSYGELGLGCDLSDGYCSMYGVEEADDGGFYVLTRGGILPPWINIKGQGRRISWQTLVEGVKQISTGEVKVKLGNEPGLGLPN